MVSASLLLPALFLVPEVPCNKLAGEGGDLLLGALLPVCIHDLAQGPLRFGWRRWGMLGKYRPQSTPSASAVETIDSTFAKRSALQTGPGEQHAL